MADQKVTDAIAQFPKEFGLRNFPGETFKISPFHSYLSDYPAPGTVYLYTYRRVGETWEAFAKGTPAELACEVIETDDAFPHSCPACGHILGLCICICTQEAR